MDEQNNNNLNNNNNDYVIGESFTIAEEPESNTQKVLTRRERMELKNGKGNKKPKKSNESNKGVVVIIVCLIAAILLGLFTVLFISEYLGIGGRDGEEITIEVKEGSGTASIAGELKESGAINSALLFRVFSKVAGYDGTYKYGVYKFQNELGYKELARMLQTEGQNPNAVSVTIPEGSSIDDIIEILAEKGVCKKSDFKAAMNKIELSEYEITKDLPEQQVYYKFEGYLYPDTYSFYNYDSAECAELAIRKMLKQSDKVWNKELKAQAAKTGYSVHEILTMASIIEMEASASVNEMPKIAAVFYNRLKWDEPKFFGSSPTALYPYGNGRYDTNKNEGFPPGPMCSPGIDAIKAAINPAKDFRATYFVSDSDMHFYYTESYSEHNKTIADLKKQGKWVG